MGGRSIIILAAAAVVLLGLCSVAMSRIGKSAVSEPGVAPEGETPKELLKPTATFNVSERGEDGINVLPQTREVADRLNDPETSADEDLQVIDELVRFHASAFKSVPQGGENIDIMRNMTGGNARGLAVLPPGHKALNENGELIDRWGTPYHFHPVSSSILEVRSAGPDLQFWTDDDVSLVEEE